jgi:hypothetical protein
MSRQVGRRSAVFAATILICAPHLYPQATTSLRGTISDPLGAVIPEAVVTLINLGNSSTRQIATDKTGQYQFLQMPPGTYRIAVEKPGFAKISEDNVVLQVNTPSTLDLRMEVGQTSETITVSTETTTINTVDASVGNNFSERQVRQLPLQTRNVVELLSLQPGVTPTGEVLGARRDQNNVTLDGVDVNDNQDAGISTSKNDGQGSNGNGASSVSGFNSVLPIPLDSVQEFRVTVGGQGANEGRSSGGQVVLITKSGSNSFHGSAYEFNRNTLTEANTWFNNRSDVPRQALIRNQFGASLGGRIIKDRIFFFLNSERRLDASALAQERFVPTESFKQGFLKVAGTDGSVQTLTPAEVKAVDPLHIGLNPGYLALLNQYPVGNDPSYGADHGLNFTGYRFNAPDDQDDRAYVGKMDFILDHAAHHTLAVRGTLSNFTQDYEQALAQFPGRQGAKILNNSKGMSALYTAILKPNLVNAFNFGYTRQGLAQSGTIGDALTPDANFVYLDSLQNYRTQARANGRILPVYNILDDLTWNKKKHTIVTGFNFRLVTNNRFTYAQSYPTYGFTVNVAVGLGEDAQTALTNFIQQRSGNSNFALNDIYAASSGLGVLLGLVNYTNVTYQFLRDGSALAQGAAQNRSFAANEYEGYVSDTYRVTREFTLTMGLRYSNDRPPYETHGLQVDPSVGLDQFFGERNFLQTQGVPSYAMPNAVLQYNLNGPVNHKPSWYRSDNNNFAPRLAIAYSPQDRGGWLGKIFGKGGVFRAGGGLVYDRFGSQLITQFDQFGSFGLATTLGNPVSYNYTNSPRYSGAPPVLPAAPVGGFPYTPPDIHGIVGEYEGIFPNLRSPYSVILNATFARELPGRLTIEVGYLGRLSRKLLLQGDVNTPLELLKDPLSGENWLQSMTAYRNLNNSGVSYTAVQNNPGLVPTNPFVEDLFPSFKNLFIPGSASANYYYAIYGIYGGSYLDVLHAADRIVQPNGKCLSAPGCYTFFARQASAVPTWMNAGDADFHGGTLSIRRSFAAGLSFDFNYTLSHSIDNASAAEGGAGQDGAVIQNIFQPGQFRGSSDFDIRHNINANFVYQLPFGKGKPFFTNAPNWVDQIIGGWQVSTIMRFRTGLPSIIQGNLTWNTNYWQGSKAIQISPVHSNVQIDSNGNPSIFGTTDAANSYADQYPGQTGQRAIIRLASLTNFDIAVAKSFRLPWEGHRLQFRAEAFNAFNNVNFISPSLALATPSTFGEFTDTTPPRNMQFALRYEF